MLVTYHILFSRGEADLKTVTSVTVFFYSLNNHHMIKTKQP